YRQRGCWRRSVAAAAAHPAQVNPLEEPLGRPVRLVWLEPTPPAVEQAVALRALPTARARKARPQEMQTRVKAAQLEAAPRAQVAPPAQEEAPGMPARPEVRARLAQAAARAPAEPARTDMAIAQVRATAPSQGPPAARGTGVSPRAPAQILRPVRCRAEAIRS